MAPALDTNHITRNIIGLHMIDLVSVANPGAANKLIPPFLFALVNAVHVKN